MVSEMVTRLRGLAGSLWLLVCLLAFPADAATFRVFGSAGAESLFTPANLSSPLNPHNIAAISRTTNVADATAFVDASGNDRSWKLHLKLRADSSDRSADRLRANEAYLQLNPRPWLDITAGGIIEKWGTGYAWNPTAFVSPLKNPADPNDRRSAYRGVDALKADVFLGGTSVSLYAMQHQRYAARVYRLVAGTDISLHLYRDRDVMRQGISLARVIGDALEVHAEVARRHALAGMQYTFPRNVNVVAEVYRSGEGLSRTQWEDLRQLAAFNLREANRRFAPLQMARNYSFVRLDVPFAKYDVETIAITNLRDASSIVRVTVTRKLAANINAYLIDTEFVGGEGSELSYVQVKRAVTFGARAYF